ncbi:MAG TPA: 16S rRNA (guanine(966)-N(2))-methyltransferase RsmD [Longimicrobiales bacterium]|nr:16S rRNA (guanine(966)-N(2))-methyltransferase RsmD [Longimicrobiales bacterium]
MRIIAGRWRGRVIDAPPGRATRPTSDRVREAWMSAAESLLRDARVLDLFAGSGALGLEALSRGARSVTFVERAGPAVRTLKANIERLGATPQATVVRADAMAFVRRLTPGQFDVVFADPPYGEGLAAALAREFQERPFADWLWIEHNAREPMPQGEGIRSRRYGDTMVTAIPAGA